MYVHHIVHQNYDKSFVYFQLVIVADFGAVFAPCMRDDVSIMLEYARRGYDIGAELGCCEIAVWNTAGTTTQAECKELTGGAYHPAVCTSEELIVLFRVSFKPYMLYRDEISEDRVGV